MADDPRATQSLVLYKKDGTKVATGDVGTDMVQLTGLASNTQVAAGDYQVSFLDSTSKVESDKADVPAFTVLQNPAHLAPANLKSVATADGATVTADAVDDGYNLTIFDSSDTTKPLFKGTGNSVTLTGIAQGTAVDNKKYVAAWVGTSTGYVSPTAAVPAFTVPVAAPTSVASAATADGATITAK